jgi:CHASE3 domain sensor protein
MAKIKQKRWCRGVALTLAAVMMLCGIAPQASAEFVEQGMIKQSAPERQNDMQQIQNVLEQKMVRTRLSEMGYTQEEIHTRLNRMGNEEIHEFANSLEDLQSGGSALGAIVTVLLIILLVVVILKLTDKEIIVT